MSAAPWPNSISRGAAVLDRIAAGFAALREGLITIGEQEDIFAECADSAAAIKRDEVLAWQLDCQTRAAVRKGLASWA